MIKLFFLLVLVACNCKKPNAKSETLDCLFARPLILGASVSAGYGTENGGPSVIVSKKLNASSEITNKAVGGATSMQVTEGITPGPTPPSIVLGFDLFFWDAARNQCGEDFVTNTKRFFQVFNESGVPLVIGKIPMNPPFPSGIRLAGTRPCAKKINDLLEELCTVENNCLIYDPKECFKAMGEPKDYFIDRLHTSDAGNEFCAEHFIEHSEIKKLSCSP